MHSVPDRDIMAEQRNIALNQLNQLNLQQILGLIGGIAALFALISGVWIWGQTPDYRVLYSNLSDRDGGDIIGSLQQMNIPYKFADGGGALLVASDRVYEARLKLASQGLPKGGNIGFELMENQKFGITQFAEQVNYQRALEGELARSVQSISAVAGARVHLAIPKPSVFVKEQQKPSASVVLSLQSGRMLDSSQASAIIHLISSSVPDLPAKNVTVVDQNGTLLSANRDSINGEVMDATKLKYVQQIEQSYINRIESLLIPLLGENNVRAQVTADIDFSRIEQTAEIYKPNQNPAESAIRSQQSSDAVNGSNLDAGGIPGALSNQPPVPATAPIEAGAGASDNTAAANNGIPTNRQKNSTVNYEVDRTIRHTVLPVGSIKRLSVAVVVNGNRKVVSAKGKSSNKPLTDAETEQINNLVKDVVGFDQVRGDSLNVQVAAFTDVTQVVEEVPLWQQPAMIDLVKNLLKYLVIAALIFFAVFRVIKPAFQNLPPALSVSSGTSTDQGAAGGAAGTTTAAGYMPAAPSYEQSLQTAKQIAQQEPKIVASVVKEWVNSNG